MPSKCEITFDHSNGVYISGENLNGKIQLKTDRIKTIRGISIKINGYAKVKWTESQSRRRHGKIEYYPIVFSAYDQYLNSISFVTGSDSLETFDLASGIHNHTFNCHLPSRLPTSCQGKYGEIKYEVIVTMHRIFISDKIFKQAFTIIHPSNLNLDPTLKIPQKAESTETACWCSCFCGGGGRISAKLIIPFSGYAPGQKIRFQMLIYNDSDRDLKKVEVKLDKRITFESRSPSTKTRYSRHAIDSKKFGPILRLTRKEFKEFIQLPSIAPSTTSSRQCIRIDYLLTAAIQSGCCIRSIVLIVPIKIGTVPLMESLTNPTNIISTQPTAPRIDQRNGGGNTARGVVVAADGGDTENNIMNTQSTNDLPPAYMSEAPPSYEDSILITGKFEDDECDDKLKESPFVPKYPVYYNFAGTSTTSADNETHISLSGSN